MDTSETKRFSKSYYIMNEILNAVTHGIGFGLSVAGLVLLIIRAVHTGNAMRITSFVIYGSCLILLYLFSTLFHSLVFTKAYKVFRIFDHCSIFLLIAGTYTPYCLVTIGGWFGWTLFGIIWGLAILGISLKPFMVGKNKFFSTGIYIVMGWLCLLAFNPLWTNLTPTGFWLLVAGGVSFTVGAFVYLIPNIKFMHVIWHLFVMLGTGFMYFSILLYV